MSGFEILPDEPVKSGGFEILPETPASRVSQATSAVANATPGVVADLDKTIPSAVTRSAAAWLGFPADAPRVIAAGADKAKAWYTGRPYEEVRDEADAR